MKHIQKIIIPIILFSLAFIVRILYVSSTQIANDEPFTIFYAQQSLGELFSLFEHENNPPLHFVLLHFWMKLFGNSVLSVRFLSVLFGALTVIPIFKIGKRYFSQNVGIVTALIFTLANIHIEEAHDARVYTLLVLLSTTLFYLYFLLLENPKNKKIIIFYSIIATLMLYAHYLSLVVLFTHFITTILLKPHRKKAFTSVLLAQLASIILFIPFLRIFLIRVLSSSQNETWVPDPTLESLYWMLRTFFNQPVVAVSAIIALIGIPVLHKLQKGTFDNSKIILIYSWFLLPYFMIFFLSFLSSYFFVKYLLFASIGFYFIVAIFWDSFQVKKRYKIILLLIPLGLMGATCNPDIFNSRLPKDSIEFVKENRTHNTIVIVCPKWENLVFGYYYKQEYFQNYQEMDALLEADNIHFIYQENEVNLLAITNFQRVIFLDSKCDLINPNNTSFTTLENNFTESQHKENYPYTISIWEKKE